MRTHLPLWTIIDFEKTFIGQDKPALKPFPVVHMSTTVKRGLE